MKQTQNWLKCLSSHAITKHGKKIEILFFFIIYLLAWMNIVGVNKNRKCRKVRNKIPLWCKP